MVFIVFQLLTDFVCLYTYEFWLSLWKIVRSSVILLLPLFICFFDSIFKLTVWHFFCFFPLLLGCWLQISYTDFHNILTKKTKNKIYTTLKTKDRATKNTGENLCALNVMLDSLIFSILLHLMILIYFSHITC
jgi:hypothetical protein